MIHIFITFLSFWDRLISSFHPLISDGGKTDYSASFRVDKSSPLIILIVVRLWFSDMFALRNNKKNMVLYNWYVIICINTGWRWRFDPGTLIIIYVVHENTASDFWKFPKNPEEVFPWYYAYIIIDVTCSLRILFQVLL